MSYCSDWFWEIWRHWVQTPKVRFREERVRVHFQGGTGEWCGHPQSAPMLEGDRRSEGFQIVKTCLQNTFKKCFIKSKWIGGEVVGKWSQGWGVHIPVPRPWALLCPKQSIKPSSSADWIPQEVTPSPRSLSILYAYVNKQIKRKVDCIREIAPVVEQMPRIISTALVLVPNTVLPQYFWHQAPDFLLWVTPTFKEQVSSSLSACIKQFVLRGQRRVGLRAYSWLYAQGVTAGSICEPLYGARDETGVSWVPAWNCSQLSARQAPCTLYFLSVSPGHSTWLLK